MWSWNEVGFSLIPTFPAHPHSQCICDVKNTSCHPSIRETESRKVRLSLKPINRLVLQCVFPHSSFPVNSTSLPPLSPIFHSLYVRLLRCEKDHFSLTPLCMIPSLSLFSTSLCLLLTLWERQLLCCVFFILCLGVQWSFRLGRSHPWGAQVRHHTHLSRGGRGQVVAVYPVSSTVVYLFSCSAGFVLIARIGGNLALLRAITSRIPLIVSAPTKMCACTLIYGWLHVNGKVIIILTRSLLLY